jgi:hypothetical protein
MAHVEQLASDPSRREEVGVAKQILNQMREAVENIGKQLAAQAQKEAQARASMQGGQVDPKTQLAIQKAQVDSQIKLQQSQLDQKLKVADVQQKMAIRDAEAAQKIRQKSLA